MVVSTLWCAAQLGAQDHERLVQRLLGLEVCQQGAHRLVQDCSLSWGPLEVVALHVPSTPAPVSRHVNAILWWSRPSLSLIRSVRPAQSLCFGSQSPPLLVSEPDPFTLEVLPEQARDPHCSGGSPEQSAPPVLYSAAFSSSSRASMCCSVNSWSLTIRWTGL